MSALKGRHGEGECSCRGSEKYTTRDGGRDGVKKKKKKKKGKKNTTLF